MRTNEGLALHGPMTAGCLLLAAALIASASCGGTVVGATGGHPDGGSRDTGSPDAAPTDAPRDRQDSAAPDASHRVPLYHRPDDSQCASTPVPGTCSAGGGFDGGPDFQCVSDSECNDGGANGRCLGSPGPAGCYCTFDTCFHDTDCKTGDVCACHGAGYAGGSGNMCLPGNCRVDSDCGAAGYCSPTHGSDQCGRVLGYYCHTPADTCIDDSDCTTPLGGACEWSATDSRWECEKIAFCT